MHQHHPKHQYKMKHNLQERKMQLTRSFLAERKLNDFCRETVENINAKKQKYEKWHEKEHQNVLHYLLITRAERRQ